MDQLNIIGGMAVFLLGIRYENLSQHTLPNNNRDVRSVTERAG